MTWNYVASALGKHDPDAVDEVPVNRKFPELAIAISVMSDQSTGEAP